MKINIEFDTNEKTLAVKADGVAIENVAYVSMSKSYYSDSDEFSCCVETMTKDEANDAAICTRLCASESREAKAAASTRLESPTIPGFFVIPQASQLEKSIASFCGK